MLTPEQLQNLPQDLTDLYDQLSEFILRDIARRIAKGAQITDTAEYQLYRAKSLGLSTDEIAAKIAEINGSSAAEVDRLIREAAAQSDEFDRKMLGADKGAAIPLEDNQQLQKLISAQIAETSGKCENLTNTIKLRRQKDIYEDFCKAADSYTQYERTYVAGYDRRLAGKTGAVTRKQREFEKAQVRLTDSSGSDKIKGQRAVVRDSDGTKHYAHKVGTVDVNDQNAVNKLSMQVTSSRVRSTSRSRCSTAFPSYPCPRRECRRHTPSTTERPEIRKSAASSLRKRQAR